MNFSEATAVQREGFTFHVILPDGWQQGPGAFGGWVLAVLVRSIENIVPGRALRSLTAEIPAPVLVGEATIIVEVLRDGASVTVAAARLNQGGELKAHAVAVLGAPRAVGETMNRVNLTPPVAVPWPEIGPLPADLPQLPRFAKHFEYRLVSGTPFSGGPEPACGWIRLREPGPSRDAALVVAHVDAWWPAEFVRLSSPRLVVTAAFTMQVIGGAAVWTGDAPVLHRSQTLAVQSGYITESRELWTEAGELVALNQQTLVVVK